MGIWLFGLDSGVPAAPECDVDIHARAVLRYSFVLCSLAFVLLVRGLLGRYWTTFELSAKSKESGLTRADYIRDTALCIHAFFVHLVIGPSALVLGLRFLVVAPGLAEPPIVMDAEHCSLSPYAAWLGTVYGGLALFQAMNLVLGWEKGAEQVFHHLTFTLLSYYCPYYNILGDLTVFAIAMELSGPALNVMVSTRAIEGHGALADAASALFALTFLFSRPLFFGIGIWRSLYFWANPSAAEMAAVAGLETRIMAVQGLFFAGWLLQLWWSVGVVSKIMRKLRPPLPKKTA